MKNPTMNDVAREADVALKTVSRYVNGATNINPVLAARIGEAIATLGYRRNLAAASLRPGHTSRVLGLLIGDVANPFYAALTAGIERAARKHGYLVIAASSEESGIRHDAIVSRLVDQQVDGLIVVPPKESGAPWSELNPFGVPVVFVDRPMSAQRSDTVLADNYGGSFAATTRLLDEGCTRLAFLGDNLEIFTMAERLRGFNEALSSRGLHAAAQSIRPVVHSTEDGAREVELLMNSLSGVDGIFAGNNRASLGTLLAFRSLGRRIPLIGFDDFEAALLGVPPVTVVTQSIEAMGETALNVLMERMLQPSQEARVFTLPTELLLRGSEKK